MDDPTGNPTVDGTTSAIPTENKPAETQEPTLPDGASERTRAEFEKLKEHNAQLKAENEAYKSKTSVLDDLKPSKIETPSLTETQVDQVKSKFVDENGYVDVAAFEAELKVANEKAKQADERAKRVEDKVQLQEETAQVRATHSAFPQLDPKAKDFDPKFYNLVRNELIGQMMNGERDFLKAAQKVSEYYTPQVDVSQAKTEAVNEYKTKVTKRDQAAESSGERSASQPTEREELIRKTLAGDRDALYKRLQASGN